MLILLVFLFIIIIWIYLIFKYGTTNKLSRENKKYFLKLLKKIKSNISPKEGIVDCDKLYHKILLGLWYKWTFWEILKLNPKEVRDINKIWELHKLRNKLVHDFDLVNRGVLKKKTIEYEREINVLLR